MAKRTSTESTDVMTPDAITAQLAAADFARQQMAEAASATSALLRAAETFQKAQTHMLQRTALLQAQTAERLHRAASPAEVMTVQSGVMLSGSTEMTRYVQELALAWMHVQQKLMPDAKEQAHTPTLAVAPMLEAWQSMLTAPWAAGAHGATAYR